MKSESELRTTNRDKLFKWNEGSKRYLSKVLTNSLVELGIKREGILFHSFRKYFITNLLEKDTNLLFIKKLARHSDLKTTEEHYLDIDIESLRALINK
ncbi:tyrosine-type recombinase/integrase [Candidatus Kapabacteria bacterium]|nr:tyrosine-type recombinase/integrase [Candidatus Kapabacteria bacterium]